MESASQVQRGSSFTIGQEGFSLLSAWGMGVFLVIFLIDFLVMFLLLEEQTNAELVTCLPSVLRTAVSPRPLEKLPHYPVKVSTEQ